MRDFLPHSGEAQDNTTANEKQIILTQHTQAVIESHDYHLADGGQDGGVVEVPTAPLITVAMNENDDGIQFRALAQSS